jgi:hypothetical protein
MSVQIAPPMRSVSGEKAKRAPAPMSGPRKTNFTGSGTAYPSMSTFAAAPGARDDLRVARAIEVDHEQAELRGQARERAEGHDVDQRHPPGVLVA